MENKKNLLVISATSLVAVTAAGCLCIFGKGIVSAKGDTNLGITFNSNTNVLNSGSESTEVKSATVTSRTGASFIFNYSNVGSEVNAWQRLAPDGCFYTKVDNTYGFNNKMNGLNSAVFNFPNTSVGITFQIYFSNDGNFSDTWSRSYTTIEGEQTIEFEGHPHYFKVVNKSTDTSLVINSLNIKYSCDESADKTWEDNHGVNPVVSGDTMTFGLYPKTHVNDATLISALETKATALGVSDEEYFWYNDEYYVRDTGNPVYSSRYFSDGTEVKTGILYYFKCEPIIWNVKQTDTNYTVDCSNLLYSHRFNETDPEQVHNLYVNSELRTWLNNNFYAKAFPNVSYIIETTLDDVEATDKVWVGSKSEYESWYSSGTARQKYVSDFALCNYTYMSVSSVSTSHRGDYLTRSPNGNEIWRVQQNGEFALVYVENSSVGISPSLTIKKLLIVILMIV